MRVPIHNLRSAILALALGLGLFPTLANAACLSPAEAREVVASGLVMPLSEAIRQAGIEGQPVGPAELCEDGGGYSYRVKVLDRVGEVTRLDIPAS